MGSKNRLLRSLPVRRGGTDIRSAMSLHQAGDLDQAETLYRRILTAHPEHVDALHFLGVLLHQRGHSDEAIPSIERAIQLAPDYVDAHNNLGNVLKETNQLELAVRSYQRVVALNPRHADAWNNLGVLLRGRGQYEEADTAYARATQFNPALVAAWQNRGNLLGRMNRLEDAVTAYGRALALRPGDTGTCDALGRTLYRAGKVEQAIRVYEQWLQADPGSSVARHMLAACTGQSIPVRASDGYVREVFDGFASSFDQVLDRLGYRAPGLIAELLTRVLPSPDRTLVVADVGCGTGLCAEFLRPRAARLVGVDLSAGMLARARARHVYDQLMEAEMTTWLTGEDGVYDLVVSADTFCYLGALDDVLSAARRALTPGALLVFTVEHAVDEQRDYELRGSGRYAHAESYVRAAVDTAQLGLRGLENVVLRRESGQDVEGLLVSAQRSAAQ